MWMDGKWFQEKQPRGNKEEIGGGQPGYNREELGGREG